jgi:translation initiation factor IF-2
MSRKATEVLVKLISMGKQGLNLNTTLDVEEATLIAQEFGHEVENVAVSMDDAIKALLPTYRDDPADDEERAPVVTVMGHVDHGKTTLLDSILGMRVAEGEAGGITQKVSAYRVQTKKGPVVFFDTPGHEAFTKLRARGAKTTDVAVLVVAADDGVMPTTVEAINHARVADVPIVVALNKIDKPNANPDRVISQLLTYEVIAEQHGGDVLVVPVSAKLKTGIEELLENLALQSEILELKANPKRPGQGTVFDATLDKGRGVVARMLVQDGTVRAGDLILSGTSFGKIRAMFDDRGKPIAKAGPSTPIEVLGLNEVPAAGDRFYVVADVKKVLAFVDEQKAKMAKGPIAGPGPTLAERISMHLSGDVTITMGVIIKAEAQASIEALSKALVELSTDKVKVQVIHSGIGGITESDVQLAAASSIPTTVIGFNVRPQGKAQQLADSSKVSMRLYTIIYDAIDELKALMIGQLKPTLVEKQLGQAEVRQVFSITKVGVIAGCMVTSGKILRTASARLVRDSVEVWKGKLGSLRRFKEDAKEVAQGYECGIGLEGYGDLKPGDIIEAYEHEEVAAQL